MPRTLNVHFLPDSLAIDGPVGGCEPMNGCEPMDGCAVVIDVLRATTTIVQAFAAGADCVWPCRTIDEARAKAAERIAATKTSGQLKPLLAGERDCICVDGFDLGNSPTEYTPSVVSGREIVFTTTNGTAAMLRCSAARRILLASFTNLSAVSRLIESESHIEIVCSGTNGTITREDVLLAGAIVSGPLGDCELDDQAQIALAAWRALELNKAGPGADERSAALAKAFESTLGGRNLIKVGSDGDLIEAAQLDRWQIVPEFRAKDGRIVPCDGGILPP